MRMMDILLFLFKVFIVILVLCGLPLILMFTVLGVIYFAMEFAIKGLYKLFDAKIPTYDDY